MTAFRVVICGGGIGAGEALLRLRRLAGDAVDVTLVAPNTHLDYRAVAVLEPFEHHPVRRIPLERIVADAGARWVQESLGWVDRHHRVVHTKSGQALPYDALLLAIGGRLRPTNPYMTAFSSEHGDELFRPLLADIDAGRLHDLAFVLPEGPTWALPLYELALLTAQRAEQHGSSLHISLITPEPAPLDVFGGEVGDLLARLLRGAGIALYCGTSADMPSEGRLHLSRDGTELRPQRTITIPRLTGPDVQGIPGDPAHRFLPIDEHCRVARTDGRVFAAGDATNCPIKHGAITAQQADTAAAGIAHLAGHGPRSEPLHPMVRATLVTGRHPLYITAYVIAGRGWSTRVHRSAPWTTSGKIVARELGPYLDKLSTVVSP